jgi:uncharacterized heparinase superfamily protein
MIRAGNGGRKPLETGLLASGLASEPRLWGLVAGEAWRRFRRRMRSGPVARWRFAGRAPDRILIAPPDLRNADPHTAQEFYAGRYYLGGTAVETRGQSPFLIDAPNSSWARALHNFQWLRHMREAGTDIAAAHARALVGDWIGTYGRSVNGLSWDPEIVAQRLIAWLQHSNVILKGADLSFYRSFLKSMALQIRYLRRLAPELEAGEPRLTARIALAFATLALPVSAIKQRAAARNLEQDLKEQILPDGGHISRNPLVLLELLADLLPLRQTYAIQSAAPPQALIAAIERMLPALRFFRHQDGALALFNGVGLTRSERLVAVLRHDESGGAPLLSAPHSGYQRLAMGGVTVIADTGKPPPVAASREANAGCLSFEMSSGRHRYIVNAGLDRNGPEEFRTLARATAAHSTATLNDTSSCRFSLSPGMTKMLGTALIGGPKTVSLDRSDGDGWQGFTARHDGYAPAFKLLHERSLVLSNSGSVLEGTDRFISSNARQDTGNRADVAAIRFHLHPNIRPIINAEGHLMLLAEGGDSWVFTCVEVEPKLDQSIFFAGVTGPVKTQAIMLECRISDIAEVHWRFTRTALGAFSQRG